VVTAPLPPEVELLALKALETEIVRRQKVAKAVIGQSYPDGEKRTFRSPIDDAKVGIVYRSDPDPDWQITDREALEQHLRAFPGNMVTSVRIDPADMPEALAVLAEYASHLLTETDELDPDAVQAALDQSKATGQPAAPGIERRKPAGVLTVRPDRGAYETVARLVQANLLTWDARPVLPAGEEAS
jgi:hypothetical protein